MKHLIYTIVFCLATIAMQAQTLDVNYLNPQFISSQYDYIRLGTSSQYFAGIMLNKTNANYGNGNDVSLFTYGNRDLTFRTGTGNIIMFPSSGGKVGIGTKSPEQKLDVRGNIINGGSDFVLGKFDGKSQGTKLLNRALVHHGNDELYLNYSGDFEGGIVMGGSKTRFPLGEGLNFTENNQYWGTNGDARIIQITDGNGTNGSFDGGLVFEGHTPTDGVSKELFVIRKENIFSKVPLGVLAPGYATGNIYLTGPTGMPGISSKSNSGNRGDIKRHDDAWDFACHNSNSIPSVKMRLFNDGKLLVGPSTTATPGDYSIYAPKGILSGEIVVADVSSSNWADYVFEEGYDIMDCEEREEYIIKEGHLPYMKSAEEVEEEGVNLVETNISLLREVEELNLIVIEQHHQMKEMTKLLESMSQRLNELEDQ